jgi:hypothetical protein
MSIWLDGIEVTVKGRWIKTATVAPECYEMIRNPPELFKRIVEREPGVDFVTFGQRLPDAVPRYAYPLTWEAIAALRVTTHDDWLNQQISKENRKNVSKAAKKGVVVCESEYSDDMVRAIKEIYDEAPLRQGKKFWHYNKGFDTVKAENGTYLGNSVFLVAAVDGAIVGFIKMVLTEGCASTLQVISKIAARDKKPNNALIAKAVEVCASRGIPYLQYGVWSDGTLGEFKASNGFQKMLVPKYVVPVSWKAKMLAAAGFSGGLKSLLPARLAAGLKQLRRKWYERRLG